MSDPLGELRARYRRIEALVKAWEQREREGQALGVVFSDEIESMLDAHGALCSAATYGSCANELRAALNPTDDTPKE